MPKFDQILFIPFPNDFWNDDFSLFRKKPKIKGFCDSNSDA